MISDNLLPGGEDGQPRQNDDETKEVIDSPGEIQESNDEKIDQDFPGYPHYPAKDDIVDPKNGYEKVDVDVEELSR